MEAIEAKPDIFVVKEEVLKYKYCKNFSYFKSNSVSPLICLIPVAGTRPECRGNATLCPVLTLLCSDCN